MNSIESLKLDFNSQLDDLGSIQNKKIFDECIYVGSGDSFVAGLIAEYLTNHKCRCYSPSDLSKSDFLQDITYCFISVTGRTRANIELARRARKSGIKTVALTLNKNSELAQTCERVVPLKITKVNTPTAGFSTFLANVVSCLQLAGIDLPKKFEIWFKEGTKLSKGSLKSVTLPNSANILGNNLLYAIALYTSFQMAEFFGSSFTAHRLEEFCHSPIFGLKKSQDIWVLGQKEERISQSLGKLGFRALYFELYNSDILTQLFESIFFVQNLILLLARKYGYTELQYTVMKDVLKASSDIIYMN